MRCFNPISHVLRCAGAVAAAMLAVSGASLVLSPSVIGVASAHDVVLSSTPADGSTVEQFPRTITLEFSAIPKDKFNTFAVSNADTGEILYTAAPERQQQMMSITLPESLQPGDGHYTIGYQITSSDGHATRGKLGFTVASPGASSDGQRSFETTATHPNSVATGDTQAPSATASGEQTTEAESGSLATVIFGGIGVIVVAIAAGLIIHRRRSSR